MWLYNPILELWTWPLESMWLYNPILEKQVKIAYMILSNFDSGVVTRGVFLDISGAFDSVPHYLLLKKISYGIRGNNYPYRILPNKQVSQS
jgi:hypothetical protein